MAQVCSICKHPKRKQIEAMIAANKSLRNIAQQFADVSIWAINRHKKDCIKPALQVLMQQKQEQGALHIFDRLVHDANLVDEAFTEVWGEKGKDIELLLKVLAESRQQNKLVADWQRDRELEQMSKRLEELETQVSMLQTRRGA